MQIFHIAAVAFVAAVADDSPPEDATSLLALRQVSKSRSGNVGYDQVNTDVKCKWAHPDRLFKTEHRSLEDCFQDCLEVADCNFFSYSASRTKKECMGCKGDTYDTYKDEDERFDSHKTFILYEMGPRVQSKQLMQNHITLQDWGSQKARVLTMWHACVAATDKAWDSTWVKPELKLEQEFCFNQMKIKYVSGHVSCRSAAHGRSFFGCDADSLGLHLVNGSDAFVFPKDNSEKAWNQANIEGFTSMNKGHAPWYKLSAYKPRGEHLWLKKKGVEYKLPADTYRMVYNEAHTGGTERDNSGVACYHVSFFLCDGEDEAQFSDNKNVRYFAPGAA